MSKKNITLLADEHHGETIVFETGRRNNMTRKELISRVKNSSFYEEPYNMLNDVQIKRIIDIIEADYEARVLEAVEELNLLIPDNNDVVEAIKALRGE